MYIYTHKCENYIYDPMGSWPISNKPLSILNGYYNAKQATALNITTSYSSFQMLL